MTPPETTPNARSNPLRGVDRPGRPLRRVPVLARGVVAIGVLAALMLSCAPTNGREGAGARAPVDRIVFPSTTTPTERHLGEAQGFTPAEGACFRRGLEVHQLPPRSFYEASTEAERLVVFEVMAACLRDDASFPDGDLVESTTP